MKVKDWLARMWGKTTTMLLGIGVTVQAIMLDSGAQAFIGMFPWMPKAVAALGFTIVVLRALAPPSKT